MISEPNDIKAELELAKAMHHFGRLAETRGMAKWLESELSRLDAANRHEEVDGAFRQRQGACQVLEKILSMASNARSRADTLHEAVRKQQTKKEVTRR